MKAVITVIGKDTIGILAKVTALCAKYDVNVSDVTQSILQDLFVMIMLIDLSKSTVKFTLLATELDELGKSIGVNIKIMHEDIFNSMHKI